MTDRTLLRAFAALALLTLCTACATARPKAARSAKSEVPVATLVTPQDAMLNTGNGAGEEVGVVDLVVTEPWPTPSDWVFEEEAVPWDDGDLPSTVRMGMEVVSLRYPQDSVRIAPEDDAASRVVVPDAEVIPPLTTDVPPRVEDAPLPKRAALDPLNDLSFDVPVEVNESVHVYLEYFQTRMRPTFSRYLIRSGRYIPMMREIFAEHGLPEDLVYIALIESGFNPYAYSRSRASGPWQFIASTGKRYGLRQDYWVDERRDVELATHAAAKYLGDLYRRFGDWMLALASYNVGEGRVAAALKRLGVDNFWDLRAAYALPQETRDYIPKFMAAAILAKSPEEYGFLPEPHAGYAVDKVTVTGATELSAIARAVGVPVEEIKFLNPQLRRGLTPPDKKPYSVRIPAGSEALFAANFGAIYEAEHELWAKKAQGMGGGYLVRHRVRNGESLSTIAQKYGTRVSAIQHANNMGRRTMIRKGQVILVPSGRNYVAVDRTKDIRHRVRSGDSLWKIANQYKVRLRDLMAWNNLTPKSVLRPGDRILIKSKGG
ncbi:MAG: LysM peptidoglycan-binding domain-containing protein [Leptospirillia bacterium]